MMYPAEVKIITKVSEKGNEYSVFEIKFANGFIWKSQEHRVFLSSADRFVMEMNKSFNDDSVIKAISDK